MHKGSKSELTVEESGQVIEYVKEGVKKRFQTSLWDVAFPTQDDDLPRKLIGVYTPKGEPCPIQFTDSETVQFGPTKCSPEIQDYLRASGLLLRFEYVRITRAKHDTREGAFSLHFHVTERKWSEFYAFPCLPRSKISLQIDPEICDESITGSSIVSQTLEAMDHLTDWRGVLDIQNETIKELELCQKSLFESIAKYTVCVLCHLERHQITQPSEESDEGTRERRTYEMDDSIQINNGAGGDPFVIENVTPAKKAFTRIVGVCMCKRFEFGFDDAYQSREPQRKFKQFQDHIQREVDKDKETTTLLLEKFSNDRINAKVIEESIIAIPDAPKGFQTKRDLHLRVILDNLPPKYTMFNTQIATQSYPKCQTPEYTRSFYETLDNFFISPWKHNTDEYNTLTRILEQVQVAKAAAGAAGAAGVGGGATGAAGVGGATGAAGVGGGAAVKPLEPEPEPEADEV
jgi:hypothetical protein